MSPERIKDPASQETLEIAIISMKAAIGGFYEFPNPDSLIGTAQQVWSSLLTKTELRNKIEDEFKIKRQIVNQLTPFDIVVDGDPVRRRYDPYHWQDRIPREFEYNSGGFILERSESLLEFLQFFSGKNP